MLACVLYNTNEFHSPELVILSFRSTECISYSSRKKSMRCYQTVSSDKSHKAYRITIIIIKSLIDITKSTLHRTTESAAHALD
jgi:hypothetical protein